MLPTLREMANDPRYTPGQKWAAAEWAARKLAERMDLAWRAGNEQAVADIRREIADATRLAAEWREDR